jgi:predicted DNA-binding protein
MGCAFCVFGERKLYRMANNYTLATRVDQLGEWMTMYKASRVLGIPITTLDYYIAREQLETIRIGGTRLISEQTVKHLQNSIGCRE